MSIRKERIKFNNNDINLKFTLDSNNNRYGYQQEIDDLTEQVKDDLINPIVDNEVRRFKYKPPTNNATELKFYFTNNGSSFDDSFTYNNFTNDEIETNDINLLKSFFSLNYYDSFNQFTQNKIFDIYNTKILEGNASSTPSYRIFNDSINQFYYWYVPKSYIDENLSLGNTIVTGYIKFNFYNAKTGIVYLFYNRNNNTVQTSKRLYFEVKLNLLNMTWYFSKNYSTQKAYQIPITNAYSKRTNGGIENFDNKKQEYPEGNVFNPDNQDYDTE